MDTKIPIEDVLRIVGGQVKLAELVNVSQSTVNYWLRRSGRIPAEKAVELETVTGGQIHRSVSRPDLWPPDISPPASAS